MHNEVFFSYLSTLEVPCIRNTRLLASFPGSPLALGYQTPLQATKETPLQVAKERVGTGTRYFKRVHTAAFKSLSLEQSHSYSSHTKAPLQ